MGSNTVEPMDTLGLTKNVQFIKVSYFFQTILFNIVQFGTSTRCVDYAGFHIFKCSHLQVSLFVNFHRLYLFTLPIELRTLTAHNKLLHTGFLGLIY